MYMYICPLMDFWAISGYLRTVEFEKKLVQNSNDLKTIFILEKK